MKKKISNIIKVSALSFLMLANTGCLQEAFPEDNKQTAGQIEKADKAALVSAIPAYMNTYSTDYYYDIGFVGFGIWRDAMTADLPVYDNGFDYFTYFNYQTYLGNYSFQTLIWRRYYYLLQKANSVISVSDADPDGDDAPSLGTALIYRAMVYMDLMRMYEYKSTGVPHLDGYAESEGIYGLTVPLITEKTTEAESRNKPRAPFQQMYRFIMDDLNLAEKMLANTHTATSKDMACLGVAYGMKARLWLEMGSRFERHGEDLAAQIDAENNQEYNELDKLAISSANDCFANAAIYARKAINEGFIPVSESQWYDPVNGFNTPNGAWMWCTIITSDNGLAKSLTWQSFVSFMSPEASYGVADYTYGSYRMIDARLFDEVDKNDWRRDTWIAPEDVARKSAYTDKYAKTTSLSYNSWMNYSAYAGFKFHPANGAGNISTSGNAVCNPLMRIEEMYLIEAEAVAHSQGAGAGKQLLEQFMNAYRMKSGTTFTCNASSIKEVTDAIFTQKRIEFWGEGLILWDYRRLEKAIERGYPGTNHIEAYRFNSYPDKVAPWTTFYIPDRVKQLNPACKLNPDPSEAIPAWKE